MTASRSPTGSRPPSRLSRSERGSARATNSLSRDRPQPTNPTVDINRDSPKARPICVVAAPGSDSSLDVRLGAVVANKVFRHWSPRQISRCLHRRWPHRPSRQLSVETIYEAAYRAVVAVTDRRTLRTGRIYRHKRGRGRDGALKQLTNLKSIHTRPAVVETQAQIGHLESDISVGPMSLSALATLIERKSRLLRLIHLSGGHPRTI